MRRCRVARFRRWHLEGVLEIEHASFGEEAYTREMFLELQRDCGELFFVARRAGRVAGYIVSGLRADRAEIVSIAVDPACRRMGLGKALMARTLQDLERRGARRVGLMVRSSDAAAISFYRGFGFRPVRRVAGYYGDGGEGLRMVREITRTPTGAPGNS
ncbi:MAG: ribosomal protein S18-alanine N-acetyltransferase [Acidobacteriota bacterium]